MYPLEHKELANILNKVHSFLIHKSFQSWWKDLCFLSVQYLQETKKYNVKIENQNAQHRCTSMKEVVLTFSTTLEKSYFSNAASHLSAYSSNGMTYKIPFWGTQPTVLIISLILFTPTRDTCLVLVPTIRLSSFTFKLSWRTFSASILQTVHASRKIHICMRVILCSQREQNTKLTGKCSCYCQ